MEGGDDQLKRLQREKRLLNILSVGTERMVRAFSYEDNGETSTEGHASVKNKKRERSDINNGLRSTTTISRLSKRLKIDECENQDPKQNPNLHASSPSLCHVATKRPQKVVSNKSVRRRKPVRVIVTDEDRTPPEWLVNMMREKNSVDAKLIFVKVLTNSDVDKGQTRLLMPWNQILDMGFLNKEELGMIDKHYKKRLLRRKKHYKKISDCDKGADVILVSSEGQQKLKLKRWDMSSTSNYALGSGWNKVVAGNSLEKGQRIRVWSFHSLDKLYIALVLLDPAPATDPTPAPAIPLIPDPAPSSPPAPVVTRDSDELYISQAEAQEESDIILPVPVPADKDWECLNLFAEVPEETIRLEALQEANRRRSLVSDTELDLELRL
ncbi:unnamed protein product [Arabidopsis lyrata]|uniref:TF-B3 domain-containing protein n=1 Tax=Arabidopsis lyrata subsp. lyrata TaxID=81972 RepID=D7LDN8_ARALL|nr:B3 domain-containing protein At2g31720 [Arabidopsis lyrata subsp. lyrata]EFH57451.1 hypothetical protein ARALYDRAFT_902206 [Arabidopsis lyrata subsp. lyrata]CAH8264401.1 unnamed protein product [Arabidopsis lyrata]|eukprot:XP_002881192.1 B3 domain-containing protein At2g31720 [Arabidopsis lyrata subsp. lyrata]